MALYRKYRPSTFAEVIGQEHVTKPLSAALDARDEHGNPNRINHAYLFSGPRGCGKTSSARILARSLNCVEGPTSTPCGVCPSCRALAPGAVGNLDVTELDAASHNGVEDMRDLREKAMYAPAESRYRVFIIDEAHMITASGFNALLKIVEEPPEHLIFIFATTEPHKLLPTIRSRTHHYPFRLLAPKDMRGLLAGVAASEGVPVEDAAYPLVIRSGGGSPRDSLSLLDQLVAGSGSEGVTYELASSLLGFTDAAVLDDAVAALASGNRADMFGVVDRVIDAGHDPRRFAMDLLDRLRDLMVISAVPTAFDEGLVDAPENQWEQLRAEATSMGDATLTRYAQIVAEGLPEMRGATSPRLLLEILCARMMLPAAEGTMEAIQQRIEQLERGIGQTGAGGVGGTGAGAAGAATDATAGTYTGAASPDDQSEQKPPHPKYERPSVVRERERKAAETAAQQNAAQQDAVQPSSAQPAATVAAAPAQQTPPAQRGPAAAQATSASIPAERQVSDAEAAGLAAMARLSGKQAPTAPTPEPTPQPESQQAGLTLSNGDSDSLGRIRGAWTDILSALQQRSKVTGIIAAQAVPLGIRDDQLTIGHHTGALVQRLNTPDNSTAIRDSILQVTGIDIPVTCVVGTDPVAHGFGGASRESGGQSQQRGSGHGGQHGDDKSPEEPEPQPAPPAPQPKPAAPQPAPPAPPATDVLAVTRQMVQNVEKHQPQETPFQAAQRRLREEAEAAQKREKAERAALAEQRMRAQTAAQQPQDAAQGRSDAFGDGTPLPPEPADDFDEVPLPPEPDFEPGFPDPGAGRGNSTSGSPSGNAPGRGQDSAAEEERRNAEIDEMYASASKPGPYDHRTGREIAMDLLARELGAKPM